MVFLITKPQSAKIQTASSYNLGNLAVFLAGCVSCNGVVKTLVQTINFAIIFVQEWILRIGPDQDGTSF